ncbi:MAG: TetR/AcrR family transcriptional regulator [Candidatus Eisenbacteria bacterium]|uniref:TetR/AcrR family transcriptional regulator n=1 Tax=Eiseniibacteriota bacterium TaxID=2212470 RepID=A0A7Y2H2V6_UNCEI|nr:TetR/AcrR family transcriptional regulator [Candidatus Eisenbacteria bacterium]
MSSRDFLDEGRVAQKRRTRQALLDAALRLLKRGEEPSLESIAREADVSRATAYRYFPRIESLLNVLPLAGLVADPEEILGAVDGGDPVGGALATQRYFYELAAKNEKAFRRLIHATLDEALRQEDEKDYEPLRGSYRLRTFDTALNSLRGRVAEEEIEKLRIALVVLSGVEALIAVKDVVGVDSQVGFESLGWAARILVESVCSNSGT